ncbi:MAG: tRNA (adenosine(37)-N6)-dimethylallyltransferase MiaA, partial [Prevotella histicola]|nr:tRNA (adenosine(37)-N6)-dimethylallyltransferase MiaA [Prevotella histicola]
MKNEQIGEGTAAGMASGKRMITILGPTASGKTDLAAHLAARLNAEII